MKISLKMSLWLTAACFVAFLLATPYTIVLLHDTLAKAKAPLQLVIAAQMVQGTVLAFIMSWIGLSLGAKVGLDSPILRCWVTKSKEVSFTRKNILLAIGFGALASILVVGFELLWFQKAIPELKVSTHVPLWKGVLTAFQGGIYEEIMLRLFFMTLIVRILAKLTHERSASIFWVSIFIATILFGIGHLPAAIGVFGHLTPLLIIRILLLNGIMGIASGYLYWKKGFEYAAIAHGVGDIIIHGGLGT